MRCDGGNSWIKGVKSDRVTLKGNGAALEGEKYTLKGDKDILKDNGKAFNWKKILEGYKDA